MATTIFLIRHGKTGANLENRFAGRTPEPLHQSGREQIAELAARLEKHQPTAIYAGPLLRTVQSAEIIGWKTGAEIHLLEAFNDINIPHWDGLSKEEIKERFGPEYPTWLSTPDRFKISGCETLQQVQERAVAGIEEIFRTRQGETIVAVSHLIVVRCLILHYLNQPISDFRSIKVDNGTVISLARTGDDPAETKVTMGEY